MSDKKISELTALTGANVADTDLLPIVDISETETKKITFGEFKTALDTATGFVRITGDTMTGNLIVNANVGIGVVPPTDAHATWSQLFLGEKGSFISEKSNSGGIYGNYVTDNLYIDADTGSFANITTDESSAYSQEAGVHKFYSQASGSAGAAVTLSEKMTINSSGNVGIGTTSPTNKLDIVGGSEILKLTNTSASGYEAINMTVGTQSARIILTGQSFADANYGTGDLTIQAQTAGKGIRFGTGGSVNQMIINSSGNVGIGTSSPAAKLHVEGTNAVMASTGLVTVQATTSGADVGGQITFQNNTARRAAIAGRQEASDAIAGYLQFGTRGTSGDITERMRIDSSGNLLVGTTDNNVSDNSGASNGGINIGTAGVKGVISAAAGQTVAYLNRLGSDGDIAVFRKDGTTVGSIGTSGGDLLIYSNAASHGGLRFGEGYTFPVNNTGATSDGAIDLGISVGRFKDLYLSGGVYLGGTGSANHLDDYEEGTFTPSWNGSVTAGTASGTFDGTYTKIGRVVYCTINLSACNLTGASGALQITGLPFSAASGNVKSGGTAYLEGITPSFSNTPQTGSHVQLYVNFGTTTAQFRVGLSAQWDNYLSAGSTFTSGGGSTYGIVSITYIT